MRIVFRIVPGLILVIMLAGLTLSVSVARDTKPADKKPSWALRFDGQRDYVSTPNIPFDDYDAFTVEVWVKGWKHAIVCQGQDGDPENSIWMSLGPWDGLGQPSRGFSGWESGKGRNYQYPAGESRTQHWDHVAMVYDGERQYLFLNGKLRLSAGPVPKPGPFNKMRPFLMGVHWTSGGASGGRPITYGSGLLRSVRISRVARYRADFSPSQTVTRGEDTVLLYDFSEGEGTRLRDVSGNERHATIHGAEWIPPE